MHKPTGTFVVLALLLIELFVGHVCVHIAATVPHVVHVHALAALPFNRECAIVHCVHFQHHLRTVER